MSKKFLLIFLFLVSCSNILYNHDDSMSMLTTKQLVIDRFGDPTDIVKKTDYDEYYYDFGVFQERLNFFDPQISTVSAQPKVSKIENEFQPQYRINISPKYIKFRLVCLLYTSPSPRDRTRSRMPSSA